MTQPRESVSFERIAERYDETRGGDKRGREIAGEVLPWLVDGPTLEVGVGTGLVAAALGKQGRPVLGVDLSPAMLARAYTRLGPRVALGDAQALPVASGSLANVYYVWVLHLVGDTGAALAEAARVLRPGGRVIIFYGNALDMSEMNMVIAPLERFRQTRHESKERLTGYAERAGLVTVHHGLSARYPLTDTPAHFADLMEQKVWSWLWRLSDEEWDALAVPAIAAVRALPDQDRPRTYEIRQPVAVFGRP